MKSITSYIPNTLTCLNLVSGALATVMALNPEWSLWGLPAQTWAFILIGLATCFDFWDGFSARLLHAYSPMGKELDSLADLVSFGLAPSMLMMSLMFACACSKWVALVSLFIVVCGALRLAKFNIDTRQTTSFIGLPIPANAIFWIGFLGWVNVHGYPGDVVTCILIAVVSLLMVSELKMFSLKFSSWGVRDNVRRYVIILAAALFVVTDGLAGLAWTIVLYVLISMLGKRTDPDAQA